MHNLVTALTPYIYLSLLNCETKNGLIMKESIDNTPTFVLKNYTSSKAFIYYTSEINKLNDALLFDLNRMAIGAFESIFTFKKTPLEEYPKSTAWLLIKCYYAAFFSAHVIIRLFGKALIQLEQKQVSKLNSGFVYSQISLPPNISIKKGLSLFSFEKDSNEFNIQLLNNGTHEDTWNIFATLLKEMESNFLRNTSMPTTMKNDASTLITEYLDVLSNSNHKPNMNWLSQMRNDINYKHTFGSWFPHKETRKSRDQIISLIKDWDKCNSINLYTDDLTKFVNGCLFTINLMKNLITILNQKSLTNYYLQHGAMKVLKVSLTG